MIPSAMSYVIQQRNVGNQFFDLVGASRYHIAFTNMRNQGDLVDTSRYNFQINQIASTHLFSDYANSLNFVPNSLTPIYKIPPPNKLPETIELIPNKNLLKDINWGRLSYCLTIDPEDSIYCKLLSCIPLIGIIPTFINERSLRKKITNPKTDPNERLIKLIKIKNDYKIASIIREWRCCVNHHRAHKSTQRENEDFDLSCYQFTFWHSQSCHDI